MGHSRKRVSSSAGHPGTKNDWCVFPYHDHEKGDWKLATWAVEYLDAEPPEPVFLSVGIRLPHLPLFTTQRRFDLYPEDSLVLPPVTQDDRDDTPRFAWYLHWDLPDYRLKAIEEMDQWKKLARSYLACISFLDSQMGRVLEALRRNGPQENTVVVCWSDHGWYLGEKLITRKTLSGNVRLMSLSYLSAPALRPAAVSNPSSCSASIPF